MLIFNEKRKLLIWIWNMFFFISKFNKSLILKYLYLHTFALHVLYRVEKKKSGNDQLHFVLIKLYCNNPSSLHYIVFKYRNLRRLNLKVFPCSPCICMSLKAEIHEWFQMYTNIKSKLLFLVKIVGFEIFQNQSQTIWINDQHNLSFSDHYSLEICWSSEMCFEKQGVYGSVFSWFHCYLWRVNSWNQLFIN